MRQLFLYPITGIFNECHDVDPVALEQAAPPRVGNPHALKELNNLWWQELLSESAVRDAAGRLAEWMQPGVEAPAAWDAIRADPDKFVAEVRAAPQRLVDLGAGPRSAFRALEALQVYANVHSQVVSKPFELSLQEGYVVNELSSLALLRASLNPSLNPYYNFLSRTAFPVIEQEPPDLVWLVGRIRLSTFAMAMRLKQINPASHVSVVGHSSEYYSLNKITEYLRTNAHLFSVVDSIVLDDFDNTPRYLREALEAGDDLSSVPNLMYVHGGAVLETGYVTMDRALDADLRVPQQRREYDSMVAPASVVAETRLWPAAQCYWNNCNFCGINRRYNTLPKNSFASEAERAKMMRDLADGGARYLWSVDEAIPPINLGVLADELINVGVPLIWETRSKIDKNFSAEICAKLGAAGLREIRLGLESGNPRVLASMGKYGGEWSLSTVEDLVSRFHQAGVSVHFPTIIGYPGETEDERRDTYQFLTYLVKKYPSVTFNINILGLDVSSKLFQEYEHFGVTTLRWPTQAKYFLGNLIDWDCEDTPFNYEALDAERNDFMRQTLYPWMPANPAIEPYIFYRLTETSRATMVWKAQRAETGDWLEQPLPIDLTKPFVIDPAMVVMGPFSRGRFDDEVHFTAYSWRTHHSVECDEYATSVLRQLQSPRTFEEVSDELAIEPVELKELIGALATMGMVTNDVDASSPSRATFTDRPLRWAALAAPAARRRRESIALSIQPRGGAQS